MAGLLSGKAMAAYAALTPEDAVRQSQEDMRLTRRHIDSGLDRTVRRVKNHIGRLGDHFT